VAILVDDMIDTGRTLSLAVRTLHENGAKTIYALISHGLLSEVNMSMLESLPFERLVVRTPRWDLVFARDLTHVSGYELDLTVKARLPQARPDRHEPHDRREHPTDP
jgi:predicted phosphoribosyltransferase